MSWVSPSLRNYVRQSGRLKSEQFELVFWLMRLWETSNNFQITHQMACKGVIQKLSHRCCQSKLPRQGFTLGPVLYPLLPWVRMQRKKLAILWPTPTASMITMADMEQARYASYKRPTYQAAKKASEAGNLSPLWIEWMMGYPPNWTQIKPANGNLLLRAQPKGSRA